MQARVTDGSEHRDFAAAKEIMGCELSFGPERPVSDILTQRPHKKRAWTKKQALLIAASLVLTVLVSSLFVPLLAFALAQLPVVGTPYQQMLISARLDVAYKAGLVRELNRSVTSNGYTLAVKAAYSDPKVSIVIVKLTSDNQATLRQLGTQGNWPPQVRLYGAFGWESYCYVTSYTYNEDEGALYGWLRTEPTPWWSGGSWTVEVASIPDAALRVKVPVQRIFGEFMVPNVKLGRIISYKDLQVRLQKMVFLPTCTIIRYHSASHVPVWALSTGGRTYTGGSHETNWEPREWTTTYPVFYPDVPDDLVLTLKGYEAQCPRIIMPIDVGSEDKSLGTSVILREIGETEEGLKVVLESTNPNFRIDRVDFRKPDGEWVEHRVVHTSHDETGVVTKLFPHTLADIQGCSMDVYVTQFIEADEDISIKIGG